MKTWSIVLLNFSNELKLCAPKPARKQSPKTLADIFMNDHIKYYFEIFQIAKTKDINKKIDIFYGITNCLFILVNNLFDQKVQIKYYERELESKCYRFGLTNHSLIKLMKGNSFLFKDKKFSMLDVDSLSSLTRMQIETFSILYYLIFDDENDETKNFRYDIYKLHGLRKQSEFKISENYIDTENFIGRLQSELNEAENNIKKSTIFNSATDKQKNEYLSPRFAKLLDTKSLFEKSGITKSRLDQIWNIYSNYAHAEHISDRQFNYRKNNKSSNIDEVSLFLDINKVLTSKLIWFIKN